MPSGQVWAALEDLGWHLEGPPTDEGKKILGRKKKHLWQVFSPGGCPKGGGFDSACAALDFVKKSAAWEEMAQEMDDEEEDEEREEEVGPAYDPDHDAGRGYRLAAARRQRRAPAAWLGSIPTRAANLVCSYTTAAAWGALSTAHRNWKKLITSRMASEQRSPLSVPAHGGLCLHDALASPNVWLLSPSAVRCALEACPAVRSLVLAAPADLFSWKPQDSTAPPPAVPARPVTPEVRAGASPPSPGPGVLHLDDGPVAPGPLEAPEAIPQVAVPAVSLSPPASPPAPLVPSLSCLAYPAGRRGGCLSGSAPRLCAACASRAAHPRARPPAELLGRCSLLQELELDAWGLSDDDLGPLAGLPLQVLRLHRCAALTDRAPALLAAAPLAPLLRRLGIMGCPAPLGGGLAALLAAARGVADLDLRGCRLLEQEALAAVPAYLGWSLRTLSLADCPNLDAPSLRFALGVSGAGSCATPLLSSLDLSGCRGLGDDPLLVVAEAVDLQESLTSLSLAQLGAPQAPLLALLRTCTNLSSLDASGSGLDDAGCLELLRLRPDLQALQLDGCPWLGRPLLDAIAQAFSNGSSLGGLGSLSLVGCAGLGAGELSLLQQLGVATGARTRLFY